MLFSVGFICAALHPVESTLHTVRCYNCSWFFLNFNSNGFVSYPETMMVLLPFCLFVKQEDLVTGIRSIVRKEDPSLCSGMATSLERLNDWEHKRGFDGHPFRR